MTKGKAWKYLLASKQDQKIPQITRYLMSVQSLTMELGLNKIQLKTVGKNFKELPFCKGWQDLSEGWERGLKSKEWRERGGEKCSMLCLIMEWGLKPAFYLSGSQHFCPWRQEKGTGEQVPLPLSPATLVFAYYRVFSLHLTTTLPFYRGPPRPPSSYHGP